MKKSVKFVLGLFLAISVFLGVALPVSAQYDDMFEDYGYDDYGYDYDTVDTISDEAAGFFGLGFTLLWCCGGIFFLFLGGFTLWMIIHAAQNAPEDEKLKWILLMVFLGFIPAAIYFFSKRKMWGDARKARVNQVQAETPAEPAK